MRKARPQRKPGRARPTAAVVTDGPRAQDFIQPPCACPACRHAGVNHLRVRRDPYSGKLLHGVELRQWYEAKAAFIAAFKKLGLSVPRGGPLKQLVEREPGCDDS